MVRIKPFRALRPTRHNASQVASVPYDVVDTAEAAALATGHPLSFLHVSRSEIDLPQGTDPYSPVVYRKAEETFRRFQRERILVREAQPCFYLYRQIMGQHVQRGVVVCCHADDYDADVIKKHEKTRRDKEDDRTRHTAALNANPGPVFLTYRDHAGVNRQVAAIEAKAPLFDFVAVGGIRHTVWKIRETAEMIRRFADVPCAYIADGHHRAASAARIARERRAANAAHTGNEEYNWFLAVLFPAGQLRILPYNRCVRDLNGMTETDFLGAIKSRFAVVEGAPASPARAGHVSVYLPGRWLGLSWAPSSSPDPVSSLDVSVLQDRLLGPILGIDDPRTSKRIEFIGGIRGTGELERRVNSGQAAVAFSMYPTTIDQLMTIADAGQIMPPKSTWFEPKLRSGLLIHTLD